MNYIKAVLTVIALALVAMAVRPVVRPPAVEAQSDFVPLFIEPGTATLRKPDGTAQLEGKVVVDLRTGDVFGFPTLSAAPYPVDPAHAKPPVSEPIYLGRFDFSKMKSAR